MNILTVFPAYEPAWAFGGVVRCSSNLCRAMAQAGATVSVYTTNANGQGGLLPVPVGRPVVTGGVSVTYFPSTFGKGSVWDSRALLHKLETTIHDFDIVYVSAIWQWMGIAVGRCARRSGIPYVVGPHGSFHPASLAQGMVKKKIFWYAFLKRCIMNASALHYTTEYERRVSKMLLPGKTSFVVANNLSDDQLEISETHFFNLRKEFGIPKESFLLLTVARPDPVKRLDLLLQAMALVKAQMPTVGLLIVGDFDNAYGKKMKRLAVKLNISRQIYWIGYQTGAALKACYCQSDLFILASAHENFSMVAAEAMAAGRPVILTKHVGIAEEAERFKSGVMTDFDHHAIADAAVGLANDGERRLEMGKNAGKVARQLYSGDHVARRMLSVLENICHGTRNPECAWE